MYLLLFSSPSLSLSQLMGVKLSADGVMKVKVSSDDLLRVLMMGYVVCPALMSLGLY